MTFVTGVVGTDPQAAVVFLLAIGGICGAIVSFFALVKPAFKLVRRLNIAMDVLLGDPGEPGIRPPTRSTFDRLESVEIRMTANEAATLVIRGMAEQALRTANAKPTPAVVQVLTEHPEGM